MPETKEVKHLNFLSVRIRSTGEMNDFIHRVVDMHKRANQDGKVLVLTAELMLPPLS